MQNSSFLTQEIAERLSERLDYMSIRPSRMSILGPKEDLQPLLAQRYREAKFADRSVDLILSNLQLQEEADLPACFQSCLAMMNTNGLFHFSMLGPDTLRELGFQQTYPDMHHVGDALLQAGFQNPVMDMEYLTLRYVDREKLRDDLQLFGYTPLVDLIELHSSYDITIEVIYGHAWKPSSFEVVVPIDQLKKS